MKRIALATVASLIALGSAASASDSSYQVGQIVNAPQQVAPIYPMIDRSLTASISREAVKQPQKHDSPFYTPTNQR